MSPLRTRSDTSRAAVPRAFRATSAPMPSSPRSGLPMPITSTLRAAARRRAAHVRLNRQIEEMRGAGDARVVVADALLAAIADDVVGLVQQRRRDRRKIGLDARLVLRGRRHDARACGSCRRPRSHSGASRCRAAPRCSRSRCRRAARTPPRRAPAARRLRSAATLPRRRRRSRARAR